MGLQYPPYAPTSQTITGTTAAVISTTPVILVGLIIEGVDSGTVAVSDGTSTIRTETAVGHFDYYSMKLDALTVTHNTDGDSTIVYFSLPSGV